MLCNRAPRAHVHFPVPTRIVSNGEFIAPPQSRQQKQVESLTWELAGKMGKPHGLGRREFLKTASGMAAAFLAMNTVYRGVFSVEEAEAADLDYGKKRAEGLADQPILDSQLHFVHDNFTFMGILNLRKYAGEHWNHKIDPATANFKDLHFDNFLKEVFLQSDTKIGLLSGAPSDAKENWFLTNDQIAQARAVVNAIAGSRRLLCHTVIAPRQPGWLEEIDRAIAQIKPDGWKGYTVGDPLSVSKYPWRMDDEALMYPAYEKMLKAGIRNVCVHKGLLPLDFRESFPVWEYAKVDDVPKAAKDWPGLNFIIYHSALKPTTEYPESHLEEFRKTGRIEWVTDLAEIPEKCGVTNVYGEIGTSFANCAVSHPRHAAALLGILIKGLGSDHVLWGTDSVWYGSPQWQIEAFRRMEIPQDLREKYGFSPLAEARSAVKDAIFWRNGARLFGLEGPDQSSAHTFENDSLAQFKAQAEVPGEQHRPTFEDFVRERLGTWS